MNWGPLPHAIRWDKATEEERDDYAGTVARLSRMAQGLEPVITDPLVYDRLARLGLGAPPRPTADDLRVAS